MEWGEHRAQAKTLEGLVLPEGKGRDETQERAISRGAVMEDDFEEYNRNEALDYLEESKEDNMKTVTVDGRVFVRINEDKTAFVNFVVTCPIQSTREQRANAYEPVIEDAWQRVLTELEIERV